MKISITSATLVLIIIAALHSTDAKELCPIENCLSSDKCEELIKSDVMCPNQEDICCSVVHSEFRTHCRHFGGECMDNCAQSLTRDVIDCPVDQTCCVLV